jgi:hypothetical protein
MATTEMHAAKAVAPASAMTSAEMSATAVTTTAVTTTAAVTAAASRQRRTRQYGRDNQNGNSNAGLRHVICSGLTSTQMTPEATESSPSPKSAQGQSQPNWDVRAMSVMPPIATEERTWPEVRLVPFPDSCIPQQTAPSFDHLVGEREQLCRRFEAERSIRVTLDSFRSLSCS